MKLTKAEKELILKKREEEENQKVKKTGVLKHDLFYLESRYPEVRFPLDDLVSEYGWWFTKDQLLVVVEQIKDELFGALKAPRGTNFDCYIEDGEEIWYDSHGIGIEGYNSDWAKKNLINITEI